MEQAEFDKFAQEYRALHADNIKVSGETPEFFAEYKIQDAAAVSAQIGLQVQNILDFGAGVGSSVPYFRKYFSEARLTCVDVSQASLAIGESRFPGAAKYLRFDGSRLPLPEASFDLAFAACVFHHIDHSEHVALLRELRRVLRPKGRLMIFEHNPLNPLTVRAVNSCPFDENAKLIRAGVLRARFAAAGFDDAVIRYRIFFPHGLRRLRVLEPSLTWLPLGAQYYVVGGKIRS